MHEKFKGTGVAVITPFDKNGKVDEKALEKVINNLVYGGVNYLVMLGTTAETPTLRKEEKAQVIDIAKETIDGRVPFVLGIGGNNTYEILETIGHQDFDAIDAILSVSPYYNKPSQEGLYQHYKAIAKAAPVPVILYNVPTRTSTNISAQTALRLAYDFKNIIGIKEASGNFDQCMQIVKGKPEHFLVISGDDCLTLPLMSIGFDGVISVIANALPKEFSDMIRACRRGDFEEARRIHYSLIDVTNLIYLEGNPVGIKALMEIKGMCANEIRLPLVKASDTLYNKLLLYK
jgi:4-hydroxy-tetrahydrodipicolinate synthase